MSHGDHGIENIVLTLLGDVEQKAAHKLTAAEEVVFRC